MPQQLSQAEMFPIPRPRRWDQPFDERMNAAMARQLREGVEPFRSMDDESFPRSLPLLGLIQFDCRLHELEPGQIIVREGDYGSSAFLVIEGSTRAWLNPIPANLLGRQKVRRKGFWESMAQLWRNDRVPEVRRFSRLEQDRNPNAGEPLRSAQNSPARKPEQRRDEIVANQPLFLQDIPGVLDEDQTLVIGPGELFGEVAALTRTPRPVTVVANGPCRLLEIRWQGFRDLMRYSRALKQHVDALYRENSLRTHLRETEILRGIPAEAVERLAAETRFESYGEFEWNREFGKTSQRDVAEKILAEPIIVAEGEYVNDLILIRNGFSRVSRRYGDGHQTVSYLGKGAPFGWREIVHNWRTGERQPYLLSLRAVGHVDVLKIPVRVVEQFVLPHLSPEQLPKPLSTTRGRGRRRTERGPEMDRGLLEFLVERRLVNGTRALMIDLDRCTRCDDCVRACATAHNNNPRFVRQGPQHGRWMIAHACMHCADPVCMIGCPTGAIGRESFDGVVTINDQTCIGCGTCSQSCPYQNIQMVPIRDSKGRLFVDEATEKPIFQATKCDLCVGSQTGPACQAACPHDALIRIDLNDHRTVADWTRTT